LAHQRHSQAAGFAIMKTAINQLALAEAVSMSQLAAQHDN
jgi:hypothetical protein